MRINHRITKLEDRSTIGVDRDGNCRWCHGRREERGGKVVVIRPPKSVLRGQKATPDTPGPTLCPYCGQDMNTYIVVKCVDMISERRRQMGLEPLAREETPERRAGSQCRLAG